jgi:hypothetical protein
MNATLSDIQPTSQWWASTEYCWRMNDTLSQLLVTLVLVCWDSTLTCMSLCSNISLLKLATGLYVTEYSIHATTLVCLDSLLACNWLSVSFIRQQYSIVWTYITEEIYRKHNNIYYGIHTDQWWVSTGTCRCMNAALSDLQVSGESQQTTVNLS